MEIYTIYRLAGTPKVILTSPAQNRQDGREFENVRLAAEHAHECGRNSGAAVVRLMTVDNRLEKESAIPQDTPPTLYGGCVKPSTYF